LLKKDKIKFYERQINLEKEIIKAAESSVKDIKNELVKELILSIALDSKKHASILNALLSMNTTVPPYIEETKLDQIKENIQRHIKLEIEAIKTYKSLLEQIEDESEKMLIQAVYEDELRHHALLKRILKSIIEDEALTQEDIWDSIKDDFIPQF
jgi:rubrerythrin